MSISTPNFVFLMFQLDMAYSLYINKKLHGSEFYVNMSKTLFRINFPFCLPYLFINPAKYSRKVVSQSNNHLLDKMKVIQRSQTFASICF